MNRKKSRRRKGQATLELLAKNEGFAFDGEIDVFLRPHIDLESLKALHRLMKQLDKIGHSLRRVVAEISESLDADPEQVIEHLTPLARATFARLGLYNTFVLAIEESPQLRHDLGARRKVLSEVTNLERDALRVTIARARGARRRLAAKR